jgi:PH (Pleckstrin Homology) domain-containing protein
VRQSGDNRRVGEQPPQTQPTQPQTREVFRVPLIALGAILLLTLCVTPVAFGAPGLQLVYLVPAALTVWLLRERTTVDSAAVVARYLLSSRRLPWTELRGLIVGRSGAVRAVSADGEQIRLPGVRFTDLGRLARASGGAVTLAAAGDAPQPPPDQRT